jgi:uncharacterized protein (DUF302 family)
VSQPYGIGVSLAAAPAVVEGWVRDALAAEGFGVLTEIDVSATLRRKLDVEFPPYRILGACNPTLAHRALVEEADAGLLLPCNVVIYAQDGMTRLAALDPVAQVGITGDSTMVPVAQDARERLVRVIAAVARRASATPTPTPNPAEAI